LEHLPRGEEVTRRSRRARALLALAACAIPLAGCGNSQQNALDAQSHQARDIASLFWWMMGGAWIGLGLVVALLFWSWKRRRRRGFGSDTGGDKPGEKAGVGVVVGMGIVMPIVVLATLFVIADIFVIRTTQAPAKSATRLTIQVIGHQWWWEVRYPGTTAVTANEIHIPVRTPVRVQVQTADVIHSFWVPELNRKIDAIPDRTNVEELDADAVGIYLGRCAEFCGLQHAHMAMKVFVDPPDVFRRWLAGEEKPASSPSGALATRGESVFMNGPCSSCHTIRGTSASGYVGPDLTHLQSRTTLAGVTIPNRKGYLAGWIVDSQHVKPGNQMPNIDLAGPQLQALLAYLEGLR
jgi:cytochrome c oxidase subunit 2